MTKKVCIIEDEKNIAEMYKTMMEQEGYEAHVFHDGASGLDWVTKNKPDLVLLDLMLPKMNGFDVLKNLHCQRLTDKLSVCVLSNLDQREDMERVFDLGAKNYFVKSLRQFLQKTAELTTQLKLTKLLFF